MKLCTPTCTQCRWEDTYWRVHTAKRVVMTHEDLLDKYGILNINDLLEEDGEDV